MTFSCILFDVDGTLIDTTDLIVEGLTGVLEPQIGRRPPREEIVALIGRPLHDQMRIYVDASLADTLEMQFMEFYEARRAELERPFPDAIRMIERARDGGRQVGLVTSKNRREIDGTLELLGFGSLLDFVICSEDAPRPKPAPDPVFEALKRAGAAAHETLFIGDSIYDMRAGADAGVNTGAALWGPFSRTVLERERPTFYFESPAAVIAALELDLHDTATPRLVRNVVGAGLKPAPTRPEAQPESGVPPRPDLHDLAAPRSERNVVGAGFKPAPARPEAAGGTAGDASSTEEPR